MRPWKSIGNPRRRRITSTSCTRSIPAFATNWSSVKIEGNKYFNTETIRERMAIQPSSVLLPNGKFNQRLLNDDVSSTKYLYQANGFLQVNVSAELEDNYQGKKSEMQVII